MKHRVDTLSWFRGVVAHGFSWGALARDDCVTPQVVAGLDGIPKYPLEPVYKGVVVQKEMDELHRARGHVPYDPNCAICQRTKSVSQHRRKQNSNNVIELSADFFHYKSHKYLVICERFSGMVGCVWMSPSTDQIRRDLRRWLEEMGCLGDDGVLSVFSDDETAVGSVFTHLRIGKDIRVTKAPPQGQAMKGLAERSVRTLKEQFLTISEEFKGEGVSICDTGNAIGSVFTYVSFMLNNHASVHGTQRSPTEFLVGKSISPLISSAYGAVILRELPTSLQTEDRPRFTEGCYLRPEFCSKASVAITMLAGELKVFNPKSIKLVLPLRWELTWMKGLLERSDSSNPRIKGDDSVETPDVIRVGLPAVPVCPKSGPPSNWFATYKLYTTDCSACRALEFGEPRKGKVHSAACCANYVRWLEEQRSLVSKDSNRVDETPPNEWFEDHGLYTSDCPACSALELGMSVDVEHSLECKANYKRWKNENEFEALKYMNPHDLLHERAKDENLVVDDGSYTPEIFPPEDLASDRPVQSDTPSPGEAGGGRDVSISRKRRVEFSEGLPSDDGMVIEKDPDGDTVVIESSDGAHSSMSRGSKRNLDVSEDAELHMPEPSSRKRPLEDEHGELMDIVLSENFGYVCRIEEVSCKFTGEDLILRDFGEVQSLVYQGKENAKEISFCGKTLKVWEPDSAVDDSALQQLDGGDTFEGMLTEMANLDRVYAGKPLKHDQAVEEANKFGVKIICCRWVTNAKVIKDKWGVRARIVVKDVAVGPKAKTLGFSSPTPSAESIKVALAVGGFSDAYVWTLDCSAAFMHTPLNNPRKIIVKLSISISWEDNSAVYVDLVKSLNGIRSASLDWLEFAQSIVGEPMKVKASAADPCVFSGEGLLMIIYVDDILVISKDSSVGKRVQDLLNEHVPTKMTGILEPHKVGQVKFVGRVIRRENGSRQLFVGVTPTYLDSCFSDFGLDKLKVGKPVIPNLRQTLDQDPGEGKEFPKLSPESYARYRRCLGKLAWMAQTREDLHVFVTYLATGQHDPDERFEKAMRQTLRFLLFDGDWELCFPATLVETNDERVETPNVSNALIRVFCDASHAPMKLTQRRGISGAFFFALGSLIKGFSRHQTCTSLSSCESEMFGIQETAQEALGLLPMVRRLVFDFFGDLAGYDGRVVGRYSKEKFAIQILTDSESAKQLLGGLDIPRRSRHTEVRVYWLRDQMRKYITIIWIAGEFNLSDILTKCSTYHFQRRASCGFVKVAPANVSEVLKRKRTKPEVALILVELCCQEDSGLKSVNTAFGYIGVTEKCEDMKTYKDVRARIDVLRNAARASGLDCHVHFHVSCPCTAGSPSLRSPVEDDDIRFGELEPILRRLPSYKRLSDSMSLEWPVNNKLWGLPSSPCWSILS